MKSTHHLERCFTCLFRECGTSRRASHLASRSYLDTFPDTEFCQTPGSSSHDLMRAEISGGQVTEGHSIEAKSCCTYLRMFRSSWVSCGTRRRGILAAGTRQCRAPHRWSGRVWSPPIRRAWPRPGGGLRSRATGLP